MAEFTDNLKGLLSPKKDKDLKNKLEKVNNLFELAIVSAISKQYDIVTFAIPQEYKYMKKEALLNIMENLYKEEFIKKDYDDGFYKSSRCYVLYKMSYSRYDGDDIKTNSNIDDAIGIEIKL